jgi:hypothetical protein
VNVCVDCGRSPRDGVRLRELRLLTDPPGTPVKYLCTDGDDAEECERIMRARRRRSSPHCGRGVPALVTDR